jgi:hypothetical protein
MRETVEVVQIVRIPDSAGDLQCGQYPVRNEAQAIHAQATLREDVKQERQAILFKGMLRKTLVHVRRGN